MTFCKHLQDEGLRLGDVCGLSGRLAKQLIDLESHPGGNPGANLKSISHRYHPILVAFSWELTKGTINLPLGCLRVVWLCSGLFWFADLASP